MKIWRAILILTCFSILFFAPQIDFVKAVDLPASCDAAGTRTYPCTDEKGVTYNSAAEYNASKFNPCEGTQGTAVVGCENGEFKPSEGDSIKIDVCAQLGVVAKAAMLVPCLVADLISRLLISITGGIMYGGGTLLDFSVDKFILNISSLFKDEAGKDKSYIYTTWTSVRDMANIIAFFAAVYAGFLRIIGQNQEDFRKAVAKLLLFALLTNFSFALSKFAIDIANVISLQAYGAAVEFKFLGNTTTSQKGVFMTDYGVSTRFAKLMGLSEFVVEQGSMQKNAFFNGLNSGTTVVVLIIFFVFTAWMFIKMAIFILTRSIMLIASVIFSPLMFIGGLVPQLDKVHDKWRETFFGNLMVAPIVSIALWLSLAIATGVSKFLEEQKIPAGSVTETLSHIAMLLIIGLCLHLGSKFAEQASGAVGQFAVKVLGGAVGGAAMAVGTAGTGFIARAGMARAAAMAGSVGKKWATQEGAGRAKKFAGGLLLKGGERMEKTQIFGRSAYDVKKGIEDKVTDKRNTVLRENRVAARSLGWTDRLEQAKTADEVAYMEQQIKRGTTYSKDTHDAEMAALKNKPIQRASASELRVLDKDLNKARDLDEKIKIKDSTVATQIQTGQKALDDEYGDIIKTRTEYLENQKRGNATAEERKKTEDYIATTRKTLADKKAELEKQLTEQKNSDTYYQDLQNQLKDLQDAYSKTTTAYKLGSAVGVMNETQRQAGEQDLAAIKGAISTLGSIKPFTTEFDQPNMAPGQVTNFQNIQKSSSGEPFNTLTPKQADSVASKLRGFKKAKQ